MNHPLGQMVNNSETIHFVVWQDTEIRETEMPLLEGEIQDKTEDGTSHYSGRSPRAVTYLSSRRADIAACNMQVNCCTGVLKKCQLCATVTSAVLNNNSLWIHKVYAFKQFHFTARRNAYPLRPWRRHQILQNNSAKPCSLTSHPLQLS
jgi:hypothetical protein